MNDLGVMKIYIAVNYVSKRLGECQKRVQVAAEWCTRKEADQNLVRFTKHNPNLPVCSATWEVKEELSLNFTR